jgi:hypothetical protein
MVLSNFSACTKPKCCCLHVSRSVELERDYLYEIHDLRQQLKYQARDLQVAQAELPRALSRQREEQYAEFERDLAAKDASHQQEVQELKRQLQAALKEVNAAHQQRENAQHGCQGGTGHNQQVRV